MNNWNNNNKEKKKEKKIDTNLSAKLQIRPRAFKIQRESSIQRNRELSIKKKRERGRITLLYVNHSGVHP